MTFHTPQWFSGYAGFNVKLLVYIPRVSALTRSHAWYSGLRWNVNVSFRFWFHWSLVKVKLLVVIRAFSLICYVFYLIDSYLLDKEVALKVKWCKIQVIQSKCKGRRYMAEILPIRRKTLPNQSIIQSQCKIKKNYVLGIPYDIIGWYVLQTCYSRWPIWVESLIS